MHFTFPTQKTRIFLIFIFLWPPSLLVWISVVRLSLVLGQTAQTGEDEIADIAGEGPVGGWSRLAMYQNTVPLMSLR